MARLCKAIEMYPGGLDGTVDGYTVLCVAITGEYHSMVFDDFQEAYSFKHFLNDLPFGEFYDTELTGEDVTEVFKWEE